MKRTTPLEGLSFVLLAAGSNDISVFAVSEDGLRRVARGLVNPTARVRT